MKPFLAAMFLVAAALPALAQTLACGIPPLAPLGCITGRPVCVCDAAGNCGWVFVGCF